MMSWGAICQDSFRELLPSKKNELIFFCVGFFLHFVPMPQTNSSKTKPCHVGGGAGKESIDPVQSLLNLGQLNQTAGKQGF